VQGGFFFHPSDEDLSPGTPEKKKPLSGCGFGVEQLENRLLADNTRVGVKEQVARKARA
jgi:hypothetical protein